jgi:hypothetical protein
MKLQGESYASGLKQKLFGEDIPWAMGQSLQGFAFKSKELHRRRHKRTYPRASGCTKHIIKGYCWSESSIHTPQKQNTFRVRGHHIFPTNGRSSRSNIDAQVLNIILE